MASLRANRVKQIHKQFCSAAGKFDCLFFAAAKPLDELAGKPIGERWPYFPKTGGGFELGIPGRDWASLLGKEDHEQYFMPVPLPRSPFGDTYCWLKIDDGSLWEGAYFDGGTSVMLSDNGLEARYEHLMAGIAKFELLAKLLAEDIPSAFSPHPQLDHPLEIKPADRWLEFVCGRVLPVEREAFLLRRLPGNIFTASARAIEALDTEQNKGTAGTAAASPPAARMEKGAAYPTPRCPGCGSPPAATDVDDECPQCGAYRFRCRIIKHAPTGSGELVLQQRGQPYWERIPPSQVKLKRGNGNAGSMLPAPPPKPSEGNGGKTFVDADADLQLHNMGQPELLDEKIQKVEGEEKCRKIKAADIAPPNPMATPLGLARGNVGSVSPSSSPIQKLHAFEESCRREGDRVPSPSPEEAMERIALQMAQHRKLLDEIASVGPLGKFFVEVEEHLGLLQQFRRMRRKQKGADTEEQQVGADLQSVYQEVDDIYDALQDYPHAPDSPMGELDLKAAILHLKKLRKWLDARLSPTPAESAVKTQATTIARPNSTATPSGSARGKAGFMAGNCPSWIGGDCPQNLADLLSFLEPRAVWMHVYYTDTASPRVLAPEFVEDIAKRVGSAPPSPMKRVEWASDNVWRWANTIHTCVNHWFDWFGMVGPLWQSEPPSFIRADEHFSALIRRCRRKVAARAQPINSKAAGRPKKSGSESITVEEAKVEQSSPHKEVAATANDGGDKWWHEPTEKRPAEYQHGPITGMKKQICTWMGEKSSRNMRRLNQKANKTVWVIKLAGKQWEVWFKDERTFQSADSNRRFGLKPPPKATQ